MIDDEFYSLREIDWNYFIKYWEDYGLNRESCLGIGCGAGRMARPISNYFNTVHTIDVSTGMVEYAKKLSLSNCIYHISDGYNIPLGHYSIDSVFLPMCFNILIL